MKRAIGTLVIVAILVSSVVLTAAAEPPELAGARVDVLVHTAKPYDAVIANIEALGGSVTHQYQNVGGLAASVPANKLADLEAMAAVEMVEKDYIIEMPSLREGMGLAPLEGGGEVLSAAELAEFGVEPGNYYSYLSSVTGAEDTWAETGFGYGAIVAVIDTGTQADHVCFTDANDNSRVIAGPDFSTDAGGPYEGSTAATNYYHGTFAAGMAASNCGFIIEAGDEFDLWLPAEAKIDIGSGLYLVPLLGTAPLAQIYAVKVFPHTGAGASMSRIDAGSDDVITQKVSGALDIDVLNMSLGGGSIADGKSFQEKLVDAATAAGITAVISAGNEGPSPNSVGRPGTAYTAVTVGAATDPVHSRIYWEYWYGAGAGATLYPADELRIAEFSGQGPNADGRRDPDVIATGVFNFGPTSGSGLGLGWSSGTSFSAPVVAGAAALLNAWAENNAPWIVPGQIRNALFDGAVPMAAEWGVQSQGYGYVNVPNALELLKAGGVGQGIRHDSAGGKLRPNITFDKNGEYHDSVTLEPGRWVDWVFEIDESTENIIIDINPGGPIPAGPSGDYGFPESFELFVKGAKRGGVEPDFVNSANVFDAAMVEITEGSVVLSGGIAGNLVDAPPPVLEPGLMKVSLQSDWTNNTQYLSADVTITRVQGGKQSKVGGVTMTIGEGESNVYAVEIPAGTTKATFDLSWQHDWTKVPTTDLDMLFASPSSLPDFDYSYLDGATMNSPERQVIDSPEPGLWYILIDGYAVLHGKDPYVLELTLEQ